MAGRTRRWLLAGGIAAGMGCAPARAADGLRWQREPDGVLVECRQAAVRLQVCNDRILRVVSLPRQGEPTLAKSVMLRDEPWPTPTFTVEERPDAITVATARVRATIQRETGEIAFRDASGALLLQEKKGGGRTFSPAVIRGRETYHVAQEFEPADEALFGLGQHQDRLLDIRGHALDLYQYNTEVFVPLVVSTRHYGILWNNLSHSAFGVPTEIQPIPDTLLTNDAGASGGLSLELFGDREGTRRLQHQDHAGLSSSGAWSNTAGMQLARWTGFIRPSVSGDFSLYTEVEGAARCWIGHTLVIDQWNPYSIARDRGRFRFEAGKRYPVRIEWVKEHPQGSFALKWQGPKPAHPITRFWSEDGNRIDYYFLQGDTMDDVIGAYRVATGRVPMLPKWAFGFWQSRERYKTQAELLDVVREFRKREIPLDVIVQDWLYWRKPEWGSHEFDLERFPDVTRMVDELHGPLHAHLMISVWAKFYPGTRNFAALQRAGFLYQQPLEAGVKDFLGNAYTYYDAFNPAARAMYWAQIKRDLWSKGVDGWWLDASEPELPDAGNTSALVAKYLGQTAAGDGAQVQNAYPLLHCGAVHQGQRAAAPDQRVCILTRSAFAGQQRYGTVVWSGDVTGRWSVLKASIPAGLGFCLSGMPYWTTDIGGFFVNFPGLNANEEYRELFTRWYQFGCFCPIFRVHGSSTEREMWYFGGPGTPAYDTQLAFDRLRYRLMPYTYSLAGMVTRRDYTMMRALVMDFPADPEAVGVSDQFLFGPALLVNPVTEYKATARPVYLPQGAAWTDFWTGQTQTGGRHISAPAPLDSLPLYVRAGSILPLGPDLQYALQKPADPIELRLYPGADGHFSLYEDEGDNNQYEHGAFAVIDFRWDEKARSLTIGARQGSFPGMLARRQFNIVFVRPGHGCGGDLTANPDARVEYHGDAVQVRAP